MAEKLLSPLNDIVFKMLVGDPAHPQLMGAFLPTVAEGLPMDGLLGLRFVDPAQRGDTPEDKLGFLDLKMVLPAPANERVNVEVQLQAHRWLRERLLFYAARLATEQVKAGDEYKVLARSICIVIANHRIVPEDERYHHQFRLYDAAAGVEFSNKLEIHTLELPKLPAQPDNTALWGWMRFLSARTEEEYAMAIKSAPVLEKAYGRLVELSSDEQTRLLAEAREKARRDQVAIQESSFLDGEEKGRAEGEARGEARGRAEGEARGRVAVAREMLRVRMPLADIAELTGLPMTEVQHLAEE